jgi:GntR family transcriptional regulator
MNSLSVNKSEPIPLHDQVAAEIRRAIAQGEASQGGRLPPAVDLAAVLGVNKNTVIRALHILRDEGLLDFTRGRGVRVVGTPDRGAVLVRIEELLDFARR